MATVDPSDGLPQKPVAFLWAQARIQQNGGNLGQQFVRSREIPRFLVRSYDAFPVMLTGEQSDLGQGVKLTPFRSNSQHSAQNSQRSVDRAYLQALRLPRGCKLGNSLACDGVKTQGR